MARRSRQRDPKLEQFWREAVAEHRRSGQSVRAYCAERRFSEANFYAWRRELGKRDGRVTPALTPTFVPVQIRAEARIEVVLPSGVILRVPAGTDAVEVARLMAALGSASC